MSGREQSPYLKLAKRFSTSTYKAKGAESRQADTGKLSLRVMGVFTSSFSKQRYQRRYHRGLGRTPGLRIVFFAIPKEISLS